MARIHLNEDYDDLYDLVKQSQDDEIYDITQGKIKDYIDDQGRYLDDEDILDEIFWEDIDDGLAYDIANSWVDKQKEDPTFIDRIYEEGAKDFEKIWKAFLDKFDEITIQGEDYVRIDSFSTWFLNGDDYDDLLDNKDEFIKKQIQRVLEDTKDLTKYM